MTVSSTQGHVDLTGEGGHKFWITLYNQMYNHIKEKVKKSKQDNERVVITGDFNAKVGETIQGNNKVVSKSGKILLKTAVEAVET